MADLITLSCPTCGSKLQITPDIDRFSCLHCGNEHMVRRGGGLITLAPVIDGLNRIDAGVNQVALEMAVIRLPKEIADLDAEVARLENQQAGNVLRSSLLEDLAAFCALASALLLLALMIANLSWWPWLLLPIALCAPLWALLNTKRIRAGRRQVQAALVEVQRRQAQKQAQLARNRLLLES
jgi:hypothetical protein